MYSTDFRTGETVFAFQKDAAGRSGREVLLEGFSEQGSLQVRMHRENARWVARVALSPGWFFYRFRVDGRACGDKDHSRVRAADGKRWNFAIIENSCRALPGSSRA